MTRTDSVVRSDGMKALLDKLGSVDAERFISLIIREPFDYTQWQEQNLHFDGLSVRDLSKQAMEQYQRDMLRPKPYL